jgi:hypothetical protein
LRTTSTLAGHVKGKFFSRKNFEKLFIAAVWRFQDAVARDAATRPLSTPGGQDEIPVFRKFRWSNFLIFFPVRENGLILYLFKLNSVHET